MGIYKVIRSSGYLEVEECEHEHASKEDARQCLEIKLQTSPYQNWIISVPMNEERINE